MILDAENIMSNAQAFTAAEAVASTNSIDFGVAGAGYNRKVFVTVAESVTSTGSATVAFALQMDNDSAFGSPTALVTVTAVGKATLVAGYKVIEFTLPSTVERYIRILYTVATEVLSKGKFNAWVDSAQQTNM